MSSMPVAVGTDGSEESMRAVEWAAREAALRGTGLRIVAVPMLPPLTSWHELAGTPDAVAAAVRKAYLRALSDAAGRAAEIEPGLPVGWMSRSMSSPMSESISRVDSLAAATSSR